MRFLIPTMLVIFLFLLHPAVYGQAESDPKAVEVQAKIACDDTTWAAIKKSKNISVYNDFLTACPDSRWSVLAKHLMKSLELDEAQKNQKRVSLSTKHDVDW